MTSAIVASIDHLLALGLVNTPHSAAECKEALLLYFMWQKSQRDNVSVFSGKKKKEKEKKEEARQSCQAGGDFSPFPFHLAVFFPALIIEEHPTHILKG